jgi:hypothetical protein
MTQVALRRGAERAQLHPGDDPVAVAVQEPPQAVARPVVFLPADLALFVAGRPGELRVARLSRSPHTEALDLGSGEKPIAIRVGASEAEVADSQELGAGHSPVAVQVVRLPARLCP